MPLEIERKFLLKNSDWKQEIQSSFQIKQGYLNSDPERTVRIRIKENKGILTIKGKTEQVTRKEFEYEIPLEEAKDLIQLCEKPLIEKTRHLIHKDHHTWEVDVFEGENEGLILAEVELESENQDLHLPSWIDEEVSHDPKYYNSSLISNPYKLWK